MRLVVLSDAGTRDEVFLRNVVPPLEDSLAAMPGATLVSVGGRSGPSGRPGRVPGWLSAIRTVRRADWVFWIQYHLRPALGVWALAYARPLARRGMLAIEQWEWGIERLGRIVEAQRPGACFVLYRRSYVELRKRFPLVQWERLPTGFNSRVFHDLGLERDIYAFSMGRRYEPLHEALSLYCAERGLVYRYSRGRGDPPDLATLNELINRARYFVVTPPDLGDRSRTGRFSPITLRYLEGPGGGSRLLGVKPGDYDEYAELLPDDAIVDVAPDASNLAFALDRADADPEADVIRDEIAAHVHAHHTWRHRAETIHARLLELSDE